MIGNYSGKPLRYQDAVDSWKKDFESKSIDYLQGCIDEANHRPIINAISALFMTGHGARFAGANQALEKKLAEIKEAN